MFRKSQQRIWPRLTLSLCALLLGGCAGLGLPRIDPTGERVFVWPRDQAPAVSPSGNPIVPPVYTDPIFPQSAVNAAQIPIGGLVPPLPQDRMSITPDRILAPVGSEVILKSGLCTAENYLLTDTKTDWLISRESAGEFVSLSGRGWCRDPLLPWNKPKKIDNQYAVGYSAKVPLTITRGTQDPSDDVQVEPGEAWATITSPVEGTSHVTAVAPEVVAWSGRRATATIYWVDTQWTFPPAVVSAGGSQILTTTVRRQTDGTPIEGWLVRYEVADGSGALTEGQSGQVVEVPTDVNGRASIDVTPTSGSGSTTQINTQIIRPERFAGSDMPRLVIANGSSTINWTDVGTPYLPAPDDLGSTPIPSLPPTTAPPTAQQRPLLELDVRGESQTQVNGQARFEVVMRNTGDATATGVMLFDRYDKGFSHLADPQRALEIKNDRIGEIAPGTSRTEYLTFDVLEAGNLCHNFSVTSREGAQAEKPFCIQAIQPLPQARPGIDVRKNGPEVKEVGQNALFTLTIKNTGDVPLTSIQVVDEYDPALLPRPTERGYEFINNAIVWNIARLEVGETKRLDVNCQCVAPNSEACSTVQVSARAGTSIGTIQSAAKKCIEILPSRNVVPPANNVVPPANNAAPPANNAVPPANNAVPPANNAAPPANNAAPPANNAAPPANNAAPPASNALPPANNSDVIPRADAVPLPGNVVPPLQPPAAGLQLDIHSLSSNPARAGSIAKYEIVVANNSGAFENQVQLRVLFPPGMVPNVATIQNDANVRANLNANNELVFDSISELRPSERLIFTIQANANQPSVGNVTAQLNSRSQFQPIQRAVRVEVIR